VSNKWTWIFGILTASAFVLAIVFFVASQDVTERDWTVFGIGALLGATASALVAVFIFHSSGRARKLAADTSSGQRAADSELKRLDEESKARIESERVSAVAESDRLDKLAAAETALIEKRIGLLEALTTRRERLDELEDKVFGLRISIEEADGHFKSGAAQALDAANHGFQDMAFENQAAAGTWKLEKERLEAQLRTAEADLERVKMLSDEEYLEEQKHLRGLD
jgi:hypothetical protein